MNSSQDEESYSRMHSLVVWLPPLVGRRAMYLFSVVIFAFAGGGRCGALLQGLAHWMELFWTALKTQIISLSFFRTCILTIRLARARNWTNFLGEHKLLPFPMALRKAFRKTGFALRAFQHKNLHVCVACLRFLPDRDPMARRSVVILMGAH